MIGHIPFCTQELVWGDFMIHMNLIKKESSLIDLINPIKFFEDD
jgi:hypothetical protein